MILDAPIVAARLPYGRLIRALRDGLAQDWAVPERVCYELPSRANLLLMPAWGATHVGVKIVTAFPANAKRGLSAISSSYMLHSAKSGETLASIDGETLTTRRTAAVAALAASYLAVPAANHVLLVGAGHVARELPAAFATVRPIKQVTIWARDRSKAAVLANALAAGGFEVFVSDDLARSAATAQIIACATFSNEPIVRGAWLGEDAHLSLIGGFRPDMREADNEAVRRSFVVADTRSGVLTEAGDLLTPIAEGIIDPRHVRAELPDLCRSDGAFQVPARQPTLFKSVGHAAQDLIAATLCLAA